ncbi:MAG: redox-sensing transcriptional repressor Rex [Coriobacteriia bacterium]|nr:redox-sensing transcriptional repressor Rex [Coriobacteriia bacterium]MBN2822934.1 redox-sensing transcriptional repressor Rex [Coriobacteriia bacterium]
MTVVNTGSERIPEGVIERLPLYLGVLIQLRSGGESTASSARLGELTDINPAQIRRDLTHFGSFGKRGVGYDIATLVERIQRILGADHVHRLALVGAGHLGSAIADYNGLRQHGFLVTAVFDNDPAKQGTHIGDLVIQDVSELEDTVTAQGIEIGVIAVPPHAAQDAADRLSATGIRIILNYTPVIVRVPPQVTLHNTDPVHELLHTLYYLSKTEGVART